MGPPGARGNYRGYEEADLTSRAESFRNKNLLLIHGSADDNVHVQNSMQLAEAFLKHKKTTWDLKLYAKRGHGIGGARQDVFRRLIEWFDRHIGENAQK